MNTEVWDRIAQRHPTVDLDAIPDTVVYAPGGPTETELRLCGDVSGKRVLDLGSGNGMNAIALAHQGAHVIALDRSTGPARPCPQARGHDGHARRVARVRRRRPRVPARRLDRPRVRRRRARRGRGPRPRAPPGAPGAAARRRVRVLLRAPDGARGRARGEAPGALPLGTLEVRRSYFDTPRRQRHRDDEPIQLCPRTIADVFAGAAPRRLPRRLLLEPEPAAHRRSRARRSPTSIVWRARKEGV